MGKSNTADLIEHTPLLAFSLYTSVQVQTLERTAKRLQFISSDWGNGVIDGYMDYYDLFWFWTLGAYEILRTMDQHKLCFDEDTAIKTTALKRKVSQLRVPFSKQELAGKKNAPIRGENSGIGVNSEGIVFSVKGVEYASNELIREVLSHLGSIKLESIRSEMPRGAHHWP